MTPRLTQVPPFESASSRLFGWSELLFGVGFLALIGGVAAWSRPAAVILFGVLCIVGSVLSSSTPRLPRKKSQVR